MEKVPAAGIAPFMDSVIEMDINITDHRQLSAELGISPCDICQSGYATISNRGREYCQDTCKIFKTYCKKSGLWRVKNGQI